MPNGGQPTPDQEHDSRGVEEDAVMRPCLEILCQPAVTEPGEEALDHPADGAARRSPPDPGSLRTISTKMRVALATRSPA